MNQHENHTHCHVQALPDDSPLSVDGYNDLLEDTKVTSSIVIEEIAGLKATLTARKKRASADAEVGAT